MTTDQGEFCGRALVVATGGPSIPKMGSSGFGYKVAEQFGLKIVPPRAALVPLTFDAALLAQFREMSGVAVDAVVSCGKARFDEALLFTHRGLSGPAILQISSYWRDGQDIVIDMAPDTDVLAGLKQMRREHPKQEMATSLSGLVPKRLARIIADAAAGPERLADFSDKLLTKVAADVNAAWIGRAVVASESPSSSLAWAPSASLAISCAATCWASSSDKPRPT